MILFVVIFIVIIVGIFSAFYQMNKWSDEHTENIFRDAARRASQNYWDSKK